uniref:Uncharacterized protein n=1 Tax=virus sp. ct5rm7 TaxID=2827298 RepID=A0A8S5RFY5_9VIRU|nr:MAG TPA: hypothetical protein [virus sp. ct5rm7]
MMTRRFRWLLWCRVDYQELAYWGQIIPIT